MTRFSTPCVGLDRGSYVLVVGASPLQPGVENHVLFAGGRRCTTSLAGHRRCLEGFALVGFAPLGSRDDTTPINH